MGYDSLNPVHRQLRRDALHHAQDHAQANPTHPAYNPDYKGFTPRPKACVECRAQAQAYHPKPAPKEASVHSAERPREHVSVALAPARVRPLPMAVPTVWQLLSQVGTVRAFSVIARRGSGFTLTVKLVHPTRGNVYRYGFIEAPEEAEAVASLWVREGYWTPDKY